MNEKIKKDVEKNLEEIKNVSFPFIPKPIFDKDIYSKFYNDGFIAKNIEINELKQLVKNEKLTCQVRNCGGSTTLKNEKIYSLVEKIMFNEFKYILNNYFSNKKYYISTIRYHYNNDKINEIIFNYGDNWNSEVRFSHYDTTPPNTIKCMIYISDIVNEQNGCLQYIPGSHLLNNNKKLFSIRKAIKNNNLFQTDDKTREIFYQLDKEYQYKNMFLLEEKKNSPLYDKIASQLVPLKYPNNIVLFDPNGIHTGGFIYSGERIALQVVISLKN